MVVRGDCLGVGGEKPSWLVRKKLLGEWEGWNINGYGLLDVNFCLNCGFV